MSGLESVRLEIERVCVGEIESTCIAHIYHKQVQLIEQQQQN